MSLLLSLVILQAQSIAGSTSGELRLEILDSSGAGMEAEGTLTNLLSQTAQSFKSDSHGKITIGSLALGRYRLEVRRAGFAGQSFPVEVRSPAPVTKTIRMQIGSGPSTSISIVSSTPLAGVDLGRNEIAAPVQVANRESIERSSALDFSSFLNRRLNGVHVNEIQGNPFQPDVNFRGYTASPLLGTPQGLSIYMDGVRINQPFGDVVSWDLIPRLAISEVTLMPGSNPLFGLNTLGGALSIQTKDGTNSRGTAVTLNYGSFNRKAVEFEHGGTGSTNAVAKGFHWYTAGNLFAESGWRTNSPTDVRQLFAKLGWQRPKTSINVSLAYANNSLYGNGLQERTFLSRDYSSVYTKPDITENRSPYINANLRRAIGNNATFSGNLYYRQIFTKTFNGDINEGSLDQAVYQPSAAERAALAAAGYSGFPASGATAENTPFPFWRCIGQVLLNDEPGEKCNGSINRGRSLQHNYGFAGQAGILAGKSQLTVGTAFDRSHTSFRQSTQLGYLNPDRGVTPVNAFADGVSGGEVDGEPFDTRVDLQGEIHTWSLLATDTFAIGKVFHVTLSGRFNRTSVDNRDRILPGGGPGSLNGQHNFQRFNPAAGLTYSAPRWVNFYFGYNEGSRAPTSIELGCADPNQPCKLPNALAGDPPLSQVVTRTFDAGGRSDESAKITWSAGFFQANNRDDILFVSAPQTGFGYFKNFGKTRRRGFQLDLSNRYRKIAFGAGYTFLRATYRTAETVLGEANSKNDDARIDVRPGDRIPLIPGHIGKVFADIQVTRRLGIDLNLIATSRSYARGNENNLHQADGNRYLGPGYSAGYAVVNLAANYRLHARVNVLFQANNLFDRRFYTAAQLGPTGFDQNGNFIARPFAPIDGEYPVRQSTFFAPGTPRLFQGGLRFTF